MSRITHTKAIEFVEFHFEETEVKTLVINAAKAEGKAGNLDTDDNGIVHIKPDKYNGYLVSIQKKQV